MQIDFNPFGYRAVVITFECTVCEETIVSDEIDIPSVNYEAENAFGGSNENEETIISDILTSRKFNCHYLTILKIDLFKK